MGQSLLVIHGNYRKKPPQTSELVQALQIISTADEEMIDNCQNIKSMYHFTITSQWFCCIDPNSPSRDTILYILGSHSNEISNYPAIFVYFTHLLPLLAPSSGYLLSISLISCLLLPGVQESFFPECLGSQPPLNLLPPLCFFFLSLLAFFLCSMV